MAIDISIWHFQIQLGQGGKNPALRTLYYRLLKLLALSIHPLFVFDGPHRPCFKRGAKIAPNAAYLDNILTKQLLQCFGFPFHNAPGEAEAECALLQREGVVDAVLSEDVDTLMFGCSLSLRNWTVEGVRGNKSPTHVDVYRSARTKEAAGLDSQGMILIALMSGGDYIPAGIPGCGIRIACQAARAGFGSELCCLARDDGAGLQRWRDRLQSELRTNESGYFLRKHKSFAIPDTFPDEKVFGYYTHPTVSPAKNLEKLRKTIHWDAEVDVSSLRTFVAEAFNWPYLIGAKHFIRGLAPALLVNKLVKRSTVRAIDRESIGTKAIAESNCIKTISGHRANWSTDGEPELRIAYVPADIVDLDLEAEEIGYNSIEEAESNDAKVVSSDGEARERSKSPTKRPFTYDPTQVEKIWVLETFIKLGVPLLAETYEEDMRDPRKLVTRKARERAAMTKVRARQGVMDTYMNLSKRGAQNLGFKASARTETADGPPGYQALGILEAPHRLYRPSLEENRMLLGDKQSTLVARKPQGRETHGASNSTHFDAPRPSRSRQINPWTLARKPSIISEYSALPNPLDPHYMTTNDSTFSEHGARLSSVDEVRPLDTITPRSQARSTKHACSASRPSCHRGSKASQSDLSCNEPDQALSTPRNYDSINPSPKKKRNLLHLTNQVYHTCQLRTPLSIERNTDQHSSRLTSTNDAEEITPSRKVDRQRSFNLLCLTAAFASPSSDSNSLPSPSALLSPPASQPIQKRDAATNNYPPPAATMKTGKNRVVVRESLNGAWKLVKPGEAKAHVTKKVYSDVDVIDLTTAWLDR